AAAVGGWSYRVPGLRSDGGCIPHHGAGRKHGDRAQPQVLVAKRGRGDYTSERSAFRSTFPTGVRGTFGTIRTSRGYFVAASRSLANSTSSSAPACRPGCNATKATTSSP